MNRGIVASTLKDVARLASVSVRTVCNVLNDHPHVRDEVRRRVRAAAEELDYRPNLLARTLRSARPGTVALVLPETDAARRRELAQRLVEVAIDLGYVPAGDAAADTARPCLVVVDPS